MNSQYHTVFPEKLESQRLAHLQQYNILDSVSETEYNDIARLAAFICETPIALITFIDARRQWVKSCVGVSISETERTEAFCNHAIQHPKELMLVEDCTQDSRFRTNPYVAGKPHFVFYAGMPLTNKQGYALGTVCVLDTKPRILTGRQSKALKLFSIQLMHMLELRRIHHEHQVLQAQLQGGSYEADEHIKTVTDHIRMSLNEVAGTTSQWEGWYQGEDSQLPACTETLGRMEINMKTLIEKMLSQYSREQ